MADAGTYGAGSFKAGAEANALDLAGEDPGKWPARVALKRLIDLVGSAALLLALAPAMGALALLVRRDGGSVLFKHRRIGADGTTFECLKFRSMCVDADERLKKVLEENPAARREWEETFKLRDDPRITTVGRFLRRSSLDELPQLINVLRGEMSLVGPRPIVNAEVPRYGRAYAYYLRCRPGITGLWQVSGRSDTGYTERVALDEDYAREWSFARDVVILWRTIGVVFRGSGAY